MTNFETKDSGQRAQFESGMQRDTEEGKARFDLLFPLDVPYREQFLTRVAELMARGAVKYEDRNWEKADSEAEIARAKSSAARHFSQWLTGETDEDHAAAVVFNLMVVETTRWKIEQAKMLEGFGGYTMTFFADSVPIETLEIMYGGQEFVVDTAGEVRQQIQEYHGRG